MGPRTVLVHGDFHLSTRLRPALAASGLHVVAHLTSPVDLAGAVVALGPEVLVAEMILDGHDIMPAVSDAVRELPGLCVVMLSPWLDRAAAHVALAAGARGALLTGPDPGELAKRIALVAVGGSTIVEISTP